MYKKFVQLLQKNKVSAYKVAKETNITQSTFSDWKHGKSNPKADKLLKIAKYFNVDISYFFE